MTTEVVGQVQAISAKQLSSGLYHSFCMADTWYRTGTKKIEGVEKGYKVKFEFTEDKYGKHVVENTFKFKEGEAPPAAAKKSYGGGAKNNSEFWEKKEIRDIETQKRISFQAATNSATVLVNSALDREYLSKPTGKMADKFAAYTAMVLEETLRLYKLYQEVPENSEGYLAAQTVDTAVDIELDEPEEVENGELSVNEEW